LKTQGLNGHHFRQGFAHTKATADKSARQARSCDLSALYRLAMYHDAIRGEALPKHGMPVENLQIHWENEVGGPGDVQLEPYYRISQANRRFAVRRRLMCPSWNQKTGK
jgi:hypothetical protein